MLAEDAYGNKKSFCSYTGNKKPKKKNLGLVLNRAGDFVVAGSYEVEVLSACSASVFRNEVSQKTPVSPLWERSSELWVRLESVVTGGNWAHIKSMGPTELLHPVELREEGQVLARLLSVIFKSLLRIRETSDKLGIFEMVSLCLVKQMF